MAHVFLSYQDDHKTTVGKIRDELKKRGYRTWFDEDDLVGSKMDGMAEAVEKAAVVIMCMSSSYRSDENCKKEIGYAERNNKPIIPIRVEAGYEPQGWVGISVESKRVINFSDPKKFLEMVEKLLKELEKNKIYPSAADDCKYGTCEDDEDDEGDASD